MLPAMSTFGQYVRLRRIEKRLSQRDLAKLAGLSSGAVSMIERGDRTELRADTVVRLAEALDEAYEEMFSHLRSSKPALMPATA